MESDFSTHSKTYPLGTSLPPLEVVDLPTPEEVFKVKKIGLEELMIFVLGPGIIALAVSLGSGEWISGPLSIGKYGWKGLGWVILVSILLQVFYNVELGRLTLATGEAPVVAFGRIPPGFRFWVPLALICVYAAYLLGGWTLNAGSSLFALINGRPSNPDEIEVVRILGILLLATTFLFVTASRKIERTLEISQAIILCFILVGLVIVTLTIVPLEFWQTAIGSLFTPSAPPRGTDASVLGSLAGFAALASGLNFMFINYYRDKGYGMGFLTGYLPGLLDRHQSTLLSSGKTFPESEKNTQTWNRWFRYLAIDQWVVYFFGALLGMIIPSILMSYLMSVPGAELPSQSGAIVFTAEQLGSRFGPILFGWTLLMGFIFLYSTQIILLELLTRNLTDAAFGTSSLFRKLVGGKPSRFYYALMVVLIAGIGVILHLRVLPLLDNLSENIANFAAIIFPLGLIYLNRRLPKPAKIRWWSVAVLLLNVLFFGFFFINFLVVLFTGNPLLSF